MVYNITYIVAGLDCRSQISDTQWLCRYNLQATTPPSPTEPPAVFNNNPSALLQLRQSMQDACLAIIDSVMGLPIKTRSLDKLYRLALLLNDEVADLFPRKSPDDKRLFRHLQQAGSNKAQDFSPADLLLLQQRVHKLMDYANTCCAKHGTLPQPHGNGGD